MTIRTRKTSVPIAVKSLLKTITTTLDDLQAEDVNVIELTGKSVMADYLVIASGRSQRQLAAIADHLIAKIKHKGRPVPVEGRGQGEWILVDAGDVIVHLFKPETRAHYALDDMWSDEPRALATA